MQQTLEAIDDVLLAMLTRPLQSTRTAERTFSAFLAGRDIHLGTVKGVRGSGNGNP